MFECWHVFWCDPPVSEVMKDTDNVVKVVNEVRVDNHDAEALLTIIMIVNVIMILITLYKIHAKKLKKRYTTAAV